MIEGRQHNDSQKILQDIIDKNILEENAMIHWGEMSSNKKKQKGFKYNKVLQNNWNLQESLNWVNEYFALNELQKRLLLKRELINAYNALKQEDRELFNSYLDINPKATSWIMLTALEKQKIFKNIFNNY